MYTFDTPIRIHYALTDQMGVVYHGHYAQFYEIGRTEAIRNLGYTYKDVEAMGIIMPVVDLHMKFIQPARYDDIITVRITIQELPLHHKMVFHGEIYIKEKLINTGTATLYLMDAKTMKRVALPDPLMEKLSPFFDTDKS
ncbi:MAG TPA: thioesterase [Chitinophagaceae bacterium]|nr:thioesterase [Chitinophagaceae bacterium]HML57749.1 thioesterase family protein [Ferruginibacter sp.]